MIVGGTAALAVWTSAAVHLRAQAGEIHVVERMALPALPAKPGYVIGRLIDVRGKSLRQRVAINIFGTTLAGRNRAFTVAVNQGRYEIPLEAGLYKVRAWVFVHYHGKEYSLYLHPTDGKNWRNHYNSTNGIVKDFVWKLSGLQAEESPDEYGTTHDGGSILVAGAGKATFNQHHNPPRGAIVELSLRPNGPLIDGSYGQVLTFRGDWGGSFPTSLPGIPIAQYTATAQILGPSGTKRALALIAQPTSRAPIPNPTTTAVFDFQPKDQLRGVEVVRLYLIS
jgi:hypothetical protein